MAMRREVLAEMFDRPGDYYSEPKRKELFVTMICLVGLLLCVFLAVAIHVQTAVTGDPVHPMSNIKLCLASVCCLSMMMYAQLWGITTCFKVMFSLMVFCMLNLLAVTGRPNDTWHLSSMLLLDFIIIMESESDGRILRAISIFVFIGFVVYTVLHVFSVDGSGFDIHPVKGYTQDFHVASQIFSTILPVLANFLLVRSYARDMRRELQSKVRDAMIASDIARELVNFDLDRAEELLEDSSEANSPLYVPLERLLCNLRVYRPFLPNYLFQRDRCGDDPTSNGIISVAMQGESFSWEHAASAVERLRDPEYTLKDFHADVEAAFPELRLYTMEAKTSGGLRCSSGFTGFEEQQRTLGALYSVYCISRLDMDGREIFAFGCDEEGKARALPYDDDTAEKRLAFYHSMEWDKLQHLFVRAGLLHRKGLPHQRATRSVRSDGSMLRVASERPLSERGRLSSVWSEGTSEVREDGDDSDADGAGVQEGHTAMGTHLSIQTHVSFRSYPSSPPTPMVGATPSLGQASQVSDRPSSVKVDVERMTALLVLTAIHDVMKNVNLLPEVQAKHAPYCGHSEGTVIHDHDIALSYIMEHFSSLLPSFNSLEPNQRAATFFAHGKMGFNNGWLVQGEAPPGPLFSKFKEVITLGGASESDISFYFAHWLTDLAGAEPFNLVVTAGDSKFRGVQQFVAWPGSEKFLLKFPLKVLSAFLDSFVYVDNLSLSSEVQVMEDYLHARWQVVATGRHIFPAGCTVACMRLALMAQGFELAAVEAMECLPLDVRKLLAEELSRTGMVRQFEGAPASVRAQPAGPAVLVYYAPALIQKAGPEQVRAALLVLAAVYRAARELFPLETTARSVMRTVVVRIEALKVLKPDAIVVGKWLLRQSSPDDAVAYHMSSAEVGAGEACIKMPELGQLEPARA